MSWTSALCRRAATRRAPARFVTKASRIPGLKLVERGKLRQDVFDTLTNMTRQPVMVGLDLKCQLAANNVAKARMQEMYAEYGPD